LPFAESHSLPNTGSNRQETADKNRTTPTEEAVPNRCQPARDGDTAQVGSAIDQTDLPRVCNAKIGQIEAKRWLEDW
jgi:hypothetical protein